MNEMNFVILGYLAVSEVQDSTRLGGHSASSRFSGNGTRIFKFLQEIQYPRLHNVVAFCR